MKTIIVTGANSGIGLETSRQLGAIGYQVILLCRSLDKSEQTKDMLHGENSQAKFLTGAAELSNLSSIKHFVNQLNTPIDGLICNAGIFGTLDKTAEGINLTFAINHLGHYALTLLILNKFPGSLKNIAVLSSGLHDPKSSGGRFPDPKFDSVKEIAFPEFPNGFDKQVEMNRRYVHSKLCNIWFVHELADRLKESGYTDVHVNAYNPGFIPDTNLARETKGFTKFMMKYILPNTRFLFKFIREVKGSSADLINCCLNSDLTGNYYDGKNSIKSSELSYNKQYAKDLWDLSNELTEINLIKNKV